MSEEKIRYDLRQPLRSRWSLAAAMLVAMVFAVGAGCGREPLSGDAVDINSLLGDMTNVNVFALRPKGEAIMLSSYDRTGGNNDWATLSDAGKGDHVLVDLDGPGVVHRFWLTGIPVEKKINLYFDGERQPRVSMTISNLFGRAEPFLPPLCDNVSGGFYCYMPFPYEKSLRIGLSRDGPATDRSYFHVNAEKFDKTQRVITFPKKLDERTIRQIGKVRDVWAGLADENRQEEVSGKPHSVPPKSQADILSVTGEGILKRFSLKIDDPEGASPMALLHLRRELVIRCYWDGSKDPSVVAPVADFFCTPRQRWDFASLPMAVVDGRYECRFPMYFKNSARIEIENMSSLPVQLETSFTVEEPGELAERNYFHAVWNKSVSSGRPYTVAGITGRGHFVGCSLMQVGAEAGWNIFEGDEQIYIDGEALPSFHGTGLEDFFNGGWYYFGLFSRPLHGLIEKAPIQATQYRFCLGDRIPFSKGFLMNMEFGHGNTSKGYMSSVAYWYQPGPASVQDRTKAGKTSLLPQQPLEPTAIMCLLFENERVGRFEHAQSKCYQYIEKYPGSPWSEMLSLRAAAYNERLGLPEGDVLDLYRGFAEDAKGADVRQQAADLLWMKGGADRALLLTSLNGQGKVFLDGRELRRNEDPLALGVERVTLSPGEHTLAVEIKTHPSYFWLSLQLRTSDQVLNTDKSWLVADRRPNGWPMPDGSAEGCLPAPERYGSPPFIPYWQFHANAMVSFQSVNVIQIPAPMVSDEWPVLYYKKKFRVTEEFKIVDL